MRCNEGAGGDHADGRVGGRGLRATLEAGVGHSLSVPLAPELDPPVPRLLTLVGIFCGAHLDSSA
jgi:hypothetical protein